MLTRRQLFPSALVLGVAPQLLAPRFSFAEARLPNRPKVPGLLKLRARSRKGGRARETTVNWKVAETGIIIIDMWDSHDCQSAVARAVALVPQVNAVVNAARSHGVMIFHCPADQRDAYEGTPFRKRMQQAKAFPTSEPMIRRPPEDKEGPLPIPTHDSPTDGCDDPIPPKPLAGPPYPIRRENAGIAMVGYDGVTEHGQEVLNFCKEEGIKNLAIMGIHTNFCITNRSFGIRQMVRVGMNVALVRDLTDALYDPRDPPHVSHARGTEMMIEHIEEHWCPSILSEDLTKVVPGSV